MADSEDSTPPFQIPPALAQALTQTVGQFYRSQAAGTNGMTPPTGGSMPSPNMTRQPGAQPPPQMMPNQTRQPGPIGAQGVPFTREQASQMQTVPGYGQVQGGLGGPSINMRGLNGAQVGNDTRTGVPSPSPYLDRRGGAIPVATMQQMPGPMSGQTLGGPQQQKQPQELVPPKPTTPLEAMALAQKANGGKPISAKEIPEWIKLIDQQKQMMFKDQMALNSAGTKAKAKDPAALSSRAETIADAIASGKQAPVLTGLYSQGAAVREALAKKGVPLEKMQLEYQKAQKQVQTLNGPQMIKFFGLANSVTNTMGEVKALAQEMKQSGVPLLNRAQIEAAMQLRGNSPEGRLATRYMSAVNTLKEEFANLAQGGYAPTEATWALADKQINGNFGVDQLSDSLDEATRLINYRVQAVTSMSPYAPTTNASGKKEEGPAAGPQKIGGDEDYAKLKSGDEFIAPDGSHRRKP